MWKQHKCPSTHEWTMKFYSDMKREAILPYAKTWMELESITISELSETEKEKYCINSLVLFSCSVLSDSLQPMDCSNAGFTVSQSLFELTFIEVVMSSNILSSVIPSFSCLQSSPASGSFPMSQFFTSGGQNIRTSASAPVFPMNIQDWFPLGWTDLISLQSKGLFPTP